MEELKPCPFCGSNNVQRFKAIGTGEMLVACCDCGARSVSAFYRIGKKRKAEPIDDHHFDNFDEAREFVTKKWNRRVNDGRTY